MIHTHAFLIMFLCAMVLAIISIIIAIKYLSYMADENDEPEIANEFDEIFW